MQKNEWKGNRRLKKRLQREFQVENPPKSYFETVRATLDNLPDELPVKVKPLRVRALRACAAMAVFLVMLAAGAYGLNLVNPLLMESMPGVGMIFQELNKTEEDTPTPPDGASSLLEEETSRLPDVPAFEPIQFTSPMNTGLLTVSNAWSDGVYLHLEMDLEVWVDNQTDSSLQFYQASSITAVVLVNGEEANYLQPSSGTALTFEKEAGLYHASWAYALPQTAEHYDPLDISLSIPILAWWDAYGNYNETDFEFYGEFQVTVDASRTLVWDRDITENGVTLTALTATPTCVTATLDIPFFGWWNSNLMLPSDTLMTDDANNAVPLGTYPVLTTQDGQVLSQLPDGFLPDQYALAMTDDNAAQGTVVFEPPPEDAQKLILTLYEYHPDFFAQYLPGGFAGNPTSNRVTAEFTIDLENGPVTASQNYLLEGRRLLDYQFSSALDRTPTPENGYIAGLPGNFNEGLTFTFYTLDMDYRPLELRFYGNGMLISSYSSTEEGYASGYSDNGDYAYGETFLSPDYHQGISYKAIAFQLNSVSAPVLDDTATFRVELVDAETGQVLIENVLRSSARNADEVYGTNLEEQLYGSSSTGEATVSDMEASPQPEYAS